MAQTTQTVQEQATKTITSTKTSITQEQSQKLIQTMLTMSFGCVAFLRGLFPDEYFVDQRFVPNKFEHGYDPKDPKNKNDSIRVKTLVRGKDKQVDLFLDWIDKGAIDAIRRGYLKSLSFSVFLDKSKPQDLHEVYTFSFDYQKDHVNFKINDEETDTISLLDSRKMLQHMMKRFIIITQSLEPLPEEKFMTMRMLFNESTPKDYQPPYFMDAGSVPNAVLRVPNGTNADKYAAGSVNTSHHDIKLKVLSRPIVLPENDELVEIDPFESQRFKTPKLNTVPKRPMGPSNPTPPPGLSSNAKPTGPRGHVSISSKPTITPVPKKEEPSQTTTMLREFLQSSQPGINPTQAIKRDTCECGCAINEVSERTTKCAACDRVLHFNCYSLDQRRSSATCFTCCATSLGIQSHESLQLLMILRRLYKLFTKIDIPSSTLLIHEKLGFTKDQNKSITVEAISFFFKKNILLLENEPRRLKRAAGDNIYQRGSSFVDVDIEGIVVNDKQLPLGRYTWSFTPKISGPDVIHLKSIASTAKKYLFEDTFEKGLEIDIKDTNHEDEDEQIINSSDHESDETKKSEEVSGGFSNLKINSSQPSDVIESSQVMTRSMKRASSYDVEKIEDDSQPVVGYNTRFKKRKASVAKRVIPDSLDY
ncbi:Meiosis-specific protein HOP1 [Wickerhamomyces ciferrii]|uniref:Meiosis-specific protein HOP1 n=1 Tax=Wickerhamomyces ciferrii (strain ATCC 14091 / BCRC 22168 / CBS 111 / JCM 3599 / NBRC 0793 / NRRL Y-1031 F-60-10) TaxID=1206466 RepID=K0KQ41_WICCF|nr:Meiosis-specific protein HOP1 [Wickerhamomyces ciferrii]CCH44262.1 Meiosis-specific protein HOP1 [Wickerhamomyces ciferrii]